MLHHFLSTRLNGRFHQDFVIKYRTARFF